MKPSKTSKNIFFPKRNMFFHEYVFPRNMFFSRKICSFQNSNNTTFEMFVKTKFFGKYISSDFGIFEICDQRLICRSKGLVEHGRVHSNTLKTFFNLEVICCWCCFSPNAICLTVINWLIINNWRRQKSFYIIRL